MDYIFLQAAGGSNMIFIVAMIAVMYFFLIRPQQQKQKKRKSFHGRLLLVSSLISRVWFRLASDLPAQKFKKWLKSPNFACVEASFATGPAQKVFYGYISRF